MNSKDRDTIWQLPRHLLRSHGARRYVFSRAIDGRGLVENEFSRRDHNRYAFWVPTGSN